jgi:hypothetical protein
MDHDPTRVCPSVLLDQLMARFHGRHKARLSRFIAQWDPVLLDFLLLQLTLHAVVKISIHQRNDMRDSMVRQSLHVGYIVEAGQEQVWIDDHVYHIIWVTSLYMMEKAVFVPSRDLDPALPARWPDSGARRHDEQERQMECVIEL